MADPQNDDGLPGPPPSVAGLSTITSNLVARLGAFLPQIRAANEELMKDNRNEYQIDVALAQQDEEDDDEEEEAEDEGHSSKPTIQLKVELADVEKNEEVFALLSSGNDDEAIGTTGNGGCSDEAQENASSSVSASEEAVSKLLQQGEEETTTRNKRRRVIIEEIA
jgi:hypothetical protein